MPHCSRCGKKAGGFTFRSFNESTQRCDRCDIEYDRVIRAALNRFRFDFSAFASGGNLTGASWAALQTRASEDGLDLNQALQYVREDIITLVAKTLEACHKTSYTPDESDLEYLKDSLAIPDSCIPVFRGLLSEASTLAKSAAAIGWGKAAIICSTCGAGVVGPTSSTDYSCGACGSAAILRRCPHCSVTVHVKRELWGRSIQCLACGFQYAWSQWNSVGVTLGTLAKSLKVDPVRVSDSSRRIVNGIVIGGAGYPITAHVGCKLEFGPEKTFIYALFEGGEYNVIASAQYKDVLSLQIGGRGAITTGGGWSGGGFGVTGIVTGVLVASALNKATTRSFIETIIHFRTNAGDLVLLNTQQTPEQLSIILSPVVSRIEREHQSQKQEAHTDPLSQLKELVQFRDSGIISEDEFQRLKANVLGTAENVNPAVVTKAIKLEGLTHQSTYYDVIEKLGRAPDSEISTGPPEAVIPNIWMKYESLDCMILLIYGKQPQDGIFDKSSTYYVGSKGLHPERTLHVAQEDFRIVLDSFKMA